MIECPSRSELCSVPNSFLVLLLVDKATILITNTIDWTEPFGLYIASIEPFGFASFSHRLILSWALVIGFLYRTLRVSLSHQLNPLVSHLFVSAGHEHCASIDRVCSTVLGAPDNTRNGQKAHRNPPGGRWRLSTTKTIFAYPRSELSSLWCLFPTKIIFVFYAWLTHDTT